MLIIDGKEVSVGFWVWLILAAGAAYYDYQPTVVVCALIMSLVSDTRCQLRNVERKLGAGE